MGAEDCLIALDLQRGALTAETAVDHGSLSTSSQDSADGRRTQEAVAIRRELAVASPDRYRPDLAGP